MFLFVAFVFVCVCFIFVCLLVCLWGALGDLRLFVYCCCSSCCCVGGLFACFSL